jgi:hypothetical protein
MNIFFTKQLSRRRRVPRERLQVVTDIAQVTKGVAKSAARDKAIFLVGDASGDIAGAISNVSDVVTLTF